MYIFFFTKQSFCGIILSSENMQTWNQRDPRTEPWGTPGQVALLRYKCCGNKTKKMLHIFSQWMSSGFGLRYFLFQKLLILFQHLVDSMCECLSAEVEAPCAVVSTSFGSLMTSLTSHSCSSFSHFRSFLYLVSVSSSQSPSNSPRRARSLLTCFSAPFLSRSIIPV